MLRRLIEWVLAFGVVAFSLCFAGLAWLDHVWNSSSAPDKDSAQVFWEHLLVSLTIGLGLIWIIGKISPAEARPKRPTASVPSSRGFPVITQTPDPMSQLEPGAVLTPKARRAMEERAAAERGDDAWQGTDDPESPRSE